MLTFELGYEQLSSVGSGVDTFHDPAGTGTIAKIDSGTIGAGYLTVGYAVRF